MSDIDITKIDLKLLMIFRAVYEEGTVSAAATRLHLGQSLVSHSLNRLRKAFSDPLFVRSGRTIAPTERADQLAPEIHIIIERLIGLTEPSELNIQALDTTFTISANDFERRVIAQKASRKLFAQAPNAGLSFSNTWGDIEDRLRKREWDVVITPRTPPNLLDIHSKLLFEDEFVCFFDRSQLSPKQVRSSYCTLRHAVVQFHGNEISPIDSLLEARGLTREIKLIAPSFDALPELLAGTSFITTLPSRLARDTFKGFGTADPPFASPKLAFKMIWHSSTHQSPKYRWFRDVLSDAVSD